MKTKELILDDIVRDWATPVTRPDCYEAMDIFAAQQSIAFAEWMDTECIRDGPHEWKYRGDNFLEKHTTEQLFNIFMEQTKVK